MNRGWLYRCLKMKKLFLTAIFILCSLTVYSQKENKLKEIDFEDTPLAEVLKKIEQLFHTSVMFVYDEVEGYFITTRIQVATVDQAMKHILHDKPFYYKKGKDFISVSQVQYPIAELIISGCVVDTACVPLASAYVELLELPEKKMVASGVSDDEGRFKLMCKSNTEMQLVAKYMGFRTTTIYLKNLSYNLEMGYVLLKDTTLLMNDVQITPKGEIEKPDRRIIFPSVELCEKSSDGLDLLSRMSLPGFDPILVKSFGISEDVLTAEIRINGRTASLYQVKSLKASDVIRVEYIYASAGSNHKNTIVNMITRQSTQWNAGADMAIAYPWSSNRIDLHGQFTNQNGQWGINYSLQQEYYDKKEQEGTYKFSFAPEEVVQQQIIGEAGKQTFEEHKLELNGHYSFSENSEINVKIGNRFYYMPWEEEYCKVSMPQGISYNSFTHTELKTNNPHANLTYSIKIPGGQEIQAGFIGHYEHKTGKQKYSETQHIDLQQPFSFDYNYTKKQIQVGGSIHYTKKWSKAAFTTGGRYVQRRASLDYNRYVTASVEQRLTQAELFLRYRKTWEKVSGNVNLTGLRQYLHADHCGSVYYSIAPLCNVNYMFSPQWSLRYYFTSQVELPEIEQNTNIILPIDRWRGIRGADNLSPARHYEHAVQLKWTSQRWNLQVGMKHRISRDPLGEYTRALSHNNSTILCYQIENGHKRYEFTPSISMTYQLVPDYLHLKLNYDYHYTQTHGGGYTCTLFDNRWSTTVYGTAGVWSYGLYWGNPRRQLLGELITEQADNNKIYVGYRYKALNVGLDWQHPFRNGGVSKVQTRTGAAENSKNKWRVKELGNRICLSVSWNIGKQIKGIDSGITK